MNPAVPPHPLCSVEQSNVDEAVAFTPNYSAPCATKRRPGHESPPATCCDGAIERRVPAFACGIIIAIIRVEQSCRSRELGVKLSIRNQE